MERHDILEAMAELKLYGMRASFDEIAGKGLSRRDEIFPLLASLIRAERTHRQARSISYRMSGARFPILKDIGKFVFTDTPVDEGLVRELATGSFLDARRNVIFIGGTGTGKTHLCIGVAAAVVRARAKARFFNLVDLVNQLEQEKAAGRTGRLAEKLLRYDLIAIDARGPAAVPPDQQAVRKYVIADHDQSGFRRLAAGVWRCPDDHCHARSPDASLRHHRNRQRQLALQEPQLIRIHRSRLIGFAVQA